MSEAFEQIIERAVEDEKFRNLLLTDPDKATQWYQLTDDERELLKNIDEDQLDTFAGVLGDRTVKGSWSSGLFASGWSSGLAGNEGSGDGPDD